MQKAPPGGGGGGGGGGLGGGGGVLGGGGGGGGAPAPPAPHRPRAGALFVSSAPYGSSIWTDSWNTGSTRPGISTASVKRMSSVNSRSRETM